MGMLSEEFRKPQSLRDTMGITARCSAMSHRHPPTRAQFEATSGQKKTKPVASSRLQAESDRAQANEA